MPGHLLRGEARNTVERLARFGVDAVVAAQVAGVVVREERVDLLRGAQASVAHQARDQLGVVDDLDLGTEVRVFVAKRVEAMRAVGDDRADPRVPERLDVSLGERLEQVLVAEAAGGIAGAELARAEDRERDRGPLEQANHRAAHLARDRGLHRLGGRR